MSENARIEINESWCKGCEICVDVCPQDVLAMEDFVAKVVDIEKCTSCMLCEVLCPDFAVIVHAPEKKVKKVKATE